MHVMILQSPGRYKHTTEFRTALIPEQDVMIDPNKVDCNYTKYFNAAGWFANKSTAEREADKIIAYNNLPEDDVYFLKLSENFYVLRKKNA